MNLDVLYREVVMEHHRHPQGREPLERVDVSADGSNPVCGDRVAIGLQLDGDEIVDVSVDGEGCAISTASGSILAEMLVGLTLERARRLADQLVEMMHGRETEADLALGDLEALAGVRQFPARIKCALLPWTTMLQALGPEDEGGVAIPVTPEIEVGRTS
jgi:nitrogen fixation protein NifU and related proteins